MAICLNKLAIKDTCKTPNEKKNAVKSIFDD